MQREWLPIFKCTSDNEYNNQVATQPVYNLAPSVSVSNPSDCPCLLSNLFVLTGNTQRRKTEEKLDVDFTH